MPRELAGHVATIPEWLTGTLNAPSFDMAPGGVPAEFSRPASAREALALFLEGVKAARAALVDAQAQGRNRVGWVAVQAV